MQRDHHKRSGLYKESLFPWNTLRVRSGEEMQGISAWVALSHVCATASARGSVNARKTVCASNQAVWLQSCIVIQVESRIIGNVKASALRLCRSTPFHLPAGSRPRPG